MQVIDQIGHDFRATRNIDKIYSLRVRLSLDEPLVRYKLLDTAVTTLGGVICLISICVGLIWLAPRMCGTLFDSLFVKR